MHVQKINIKSSRQFEPNYVDQMLEILRQKPPKELTLQGHPVYCHKPLQDSVVKKLQAFGLLSRLRQLDLSGNKIATKESVQLILTEGQMLKRLDLSRNKLSSSAIEYLC